MARSVRVGEFQQMQRASKGPNHTALGESDALGDRETSSSDVAAVDQLTGQVVEARTERTITVAEQLAALRLDGVGGETTRGEISLRLRGALAEHGIPASEEQLADEADRRWCDLYPGRAVRAENGYRVYDDPGAPVEPMAEDRAEDGLDERVAGRAEKLAGELGRAHVVDVNPDGTVADVRPAERTPDRGPEVGTTVHQVTDEEPRFSGGGADDVSAGSALIPRDAEFNGRLYRDAPELANIAEKLIGEHGFLEDLGHCDIRWYWKRKTGVSKGRVKIGFMKRASDLLGHFSGADFIGWLSATTARDGRFTDQQVEAAVFHQLLHVGSDDKGNWIFLPHDFEGFGQEVRVYGTWTSDLKLGGTAFVAAHQMGLFTDEDDEEDEELQERRPREPFMGDEPADPDQSYDDELEDLPTGEEIDASCRCPHGHAGCDGRHDLADDPLADPAVI